MEKKNVKLIFYIIGIICIVFEAICGITATTIFESMSSKLTIITYWLFLIFVSGLGDK